MYISRSPLPTGGKVLAAHSFRNGNGIIVSTHSRPAILARLVGTSSLTATLMLLSLNAGIHHSNAQTPGPERSSGSSQTNLASSTDHARRLITTRSEPLKGIDLTGELQRLGQDPETRGIVVTFLSTQCPISNGYLPVLNELARRYQSLGIEFFGVVSDPAVTRSDATAHKKSYGVGFPVLFDGSGELRLALSPTHTPQTFVLGRTGIKLYSGAIDDRYLQVGKKKDYAKKRYLENAIQSVINGNQVLTPVTEPIGCLLEDPPNKTISGEVTYTRDIAPIIQSNCVGCHRPGQSAPFPLRSYEEVSGHANQIVEVTHSRFMPPWKPAPGFTRFLDEARLTKHELALLRKWVELGKPQGNPKDLPAPAVHAEGWQLGEPDVVLTMQDVFPIPAQGPDIRQYFVIPTGIARDRLITAIEFRPGTPQAVHHASFFMDEHHVARKLDQTDPAPGYAGFGGPKFESQGTLSSWFPGMTPRRLPEGMGRLLPGGSDIVAELHYVTTGKPEHDRSTIGLHFAPSSANRVVAEIQVGNKQIKIPAGKERHLERATYRLPVDTILLDMVPHMHMLGREMKVWTRSPDGKTLPLMWIKDWDFNWQSQYSFARPIRLKKGTDLIVDAWYDNSAGNPLNPNSPPKTVRWGDNSTDEMLICHFQCTCTTMEQLETLIDDQSKYIASHQKR